jgi:hypothetical protein
MQLGDAGSRRDLLTLIEAKANTVAETTVLRQIKAWTQKLNVSSGVKNGSRKVRRGCPKHSHERTSQGGD